MAPLQILSAVWLLAPFSGQDSQAIEFGRAAMRQMLETSKAPGASVAVAVRGQVVWKQGFGYADLEGKAPATAHTRFGIGSITKSLTTALVAKLAEQGKMNWDTPIETYLPDWPHKGKGITLRLIAAHLSGMNDAFSSGLMFTPTAFTTEEALKEIFKEPLRAEPGVESFYGTGTYTVIAGAIEAVTKRPFTGAMHQTVLQPLGMEETIPNDPTVKHAHKTIFYRLDAEGKIERTPYFDPSHKRAGAGYLSTAPDLARFGSALLRPGFLGERARANLFLEAKTAKGEPTSFALGWRTVKDFKDRPIYAQPGGGPGISGVVAMWPKDGVVVVVLSNLTGAAVGRPAQEIGDRFVEGKGR